MNDMHDAGGLAELGGLTSMDLNMLVALGALLRSGSVTQAAVQTGVTQSAMSHTLRRLRDTFGDPLFVRAGGAMVPTPRAESLRAPLQSALLTLARVVGAPEGFDPSTTRRTFRVASPDIFDLLVLPTLLSHLSCAAPHIDLVFVPPRPATLAERLMTGDLDLSIIPLAPWSGLSGDDSELMQQKLFDDTYSCYVRKGHPLLRRGRLDLDAYVEAHHVMVSPSGSGPGIVEAPLAKMHRERRVALRVPAFASAPSIVAESDLVLTAPTSLAGLVKHLPIVRVPAPVELGAHGVGMMWHRRFDAEGGNQWLRERMVVACKGLKGRRR